ncbi:MULTISPECIES: ATP-binding protein [Rhodomicrobium]|uniref:ATP-binding protein n=1 Tax=Rhodomicrobium TaxID=1068 RepID=UPI000B4BCB75|nr:MULTISPECIES: ATP-binding protein [Rhodomicrobium]
MKRNSLSRRLFFSSAIWTLLVLPFAAAVLVSLYRDAVERSFDARLNQYLEYLIAITSPDQGIDVMEPANLGEPLFSLPSSGWYWEIKSLGGPPVDFKSVSLASEALKLPSQMGVVPDETEIRKAYLAGPEQQALRVLEREITITQKDQQRRYAYAVAGDAGEIGDEVAAFSTMLVIAFCMLGAGLLIATFFQVRFGLRPLDEIGEKLVAIRSGKASRLEGSLPEEIQPLQEELNALIQSNQAIIERARTHVGNLAHALKTPLSVITNEAREREDEFGQKVADQAELMREYITHHLTRAQIAARVSIVGGVTDVSETVNSLTHALSRIYSDRNISFVVECPSDAKFRGEKQDLQEMVGNLLDNACKWADAKVKISVATDGSAKTASNTRNLTVLVDDDGPGLPLSELESVVRRGKRLDETKPGSGLGLSIVADLSEMYYGSFVLQQAPTGGVRAKLTLPAA